MSEGGKTYCFVSEGGKENTYFCPGGWKNHSLVRGGHGEFPTPSYFFNRIALSIKWLKRYIRSGIFQSFTWEVIASGIGIVWNVKMEVYCDSGVLGSGGYWDCTDAWTLTLKLHCTAAGLPSSDKENYSIKNWERIGSFSEGGPGFSKIQ